MSRRLGSDWKDRSLLKNLRGFIGLRWVAGTMVLIGALIEWRLTRWYHVAPRLAFMGGAILLYNAVLFALVRRAPLGHRALLSLAWVQVLLDLACLSLLALWTGGTSSPLLGFFVFHMVFASLLLSRWVAYAAAAVALAMFCVGLWFTGRWPDTDEARLMLLGWAMTVVLTVYLANRITRDLRRQQRRLMRQNRHIAAIGRQLRRHQSTMVQHEKMVALGQMAAGVAHEVANPLASMDGLLQVLQRKPERVGPETLTTLRQLVERIHHIVRQLTTFAHPEDAHWQMLPLNDVVDGALQMAHFDARLRRIRIDRQFSPDAGALRVLPHAIQQVIVNLLLNAADATSASEHPTVAIRTQRSVEECIVEVHDNGQGIHPEHLRRLFEPFFTTKPVGSGTGLGLSISYSLVRRHGGRITVRSRPGEGATFTIHLPLVAVPAAVIR